MNIIKRAKSPTPKFFKILRSIGLALVGVGGVIAASPVALPAIVDSVSGYLAVAGGVLAVVSQITVDSGKSGNKL